MNDPNAATGTRIIGIACERSVDFEDRLDENQCLKDDPSVRMVFVPCSGHIQPIMLETALKSGADGVFAMGCRMGDCHYREGNVFCNQRLTGERMPKLKPTVDKRRVQGYWLSAVEYDEFINRVRTFHSELQNLNQNTEAQQKAS